jgi:hypothetical protein
MIRDYSRRTDIAQGGRAAASFVVAHSLEARGDNAAAFEEYARANAETDARNAPDQNHNNFAGHSAWTDAIIDVFRDAAPSGAGAYHEGPQPIFVVGLPRCGSTLVESVIAAHSQVDAGGELPMMPNIFNIWMRENHHLGEARLSAEERERIARA